MFPLREKIKFEAEDAELETIINSKRFGAFTMFQARYRKYLHIFSQLILTTIYHPSTTTDPILQWGVGGPRE